MTEYDYKGFTIVYKISAAKKNSNLFQAEGYARCSVDQNNPAPSKKFHTEYPSQAGVKAEIKKLVEHYVDFEWKKFHEIHGELSL